MTNGKQQSTAAASATRSSDGKSITEDGSMEGIAVSWKLGLFDTVTAQWQHCGKNDNVNSVTAVQGERATRGIALPWLSGLLLQQLVAYMFVGGRAIVFACKPGKQRWQQHHSTVTLAVDNR